MSACKLAAAQANGKDGSDLAHRRSSTCRHQQCKMNAKNKEPLDTDDELRVTVSAAMASWWDDHHSALDRLACQTSGILPVKPGQWNTQTHVSRVHLEVSDVVPRYSLFKVDRVETLTVEEAFKAQPELEKGFKAAMKEAQHEPQAVGAAVVLVRFRSFEHMKAHCVLACRTDPVGIKEEGIDWKEVIDKNQGRPCIGCSLPKAGRA